MLFKLKISGEVNIENGIVLICEKGLKITFKNTEIDLSKLGIWGRGNYIALKEFEICKIIEWIKKSEKEKDGFNKFFAIWVAFNNFYNICSDKKSEKKRIEESLRFLEKEDKEKIIEKLSDDINNWLDTIAVLRFRYGNENLNEKCKEYLKNGKYECALKYLMFCLYAIRCNLFHGEKRVQSDRQNTILIQAYKFLKTIFSVLLASYLIKNRE